MIWLCVWESFAADSECLAGDTLALQKHGSLCLWAWQSPEHILKNIMVKFSLVAAFRPPKHFLSGFNTVSHILSKFDCVVAPFLWWWRSLQRENWTRYMLHRCATHCWEMARAAPNQSCQKTCPRWECESITVSSLFNPHISPERRKQPCSKLLLAKSIVSPCVSV